MGKAQKGLLTRTLGKQPSLYLCNVIEKIDSLSGDIDYQKSQILQL